MSLGKYVTNLAVVGSLLGALGAAKQAEQMPRDWRRFLVWGVWAAGLALSIAGVAKQEQDEAFAQSLKDAEREAKAAAKARRRRR